MDKQCCADWKNRFEVAARVRAGCLTFALGEGVIDTLNTDTMTGAMRGEGGGWERKPGAT